MDAIEAIIGRASPARLAGPGPDDAQLNTILRAGSRAPDHGRLQPFRFLVIEGDARMRLGELMAGALQRREPAASGEALASERAKALRAPTLIVVAAAPRNNPKVPEIEQIVAAGAAAQNMLLAAHALGLGGWWRTGPASYDAELKTGLGFAERDVIVAILYIGAPAAPAPERAVDVAALTRRL